jgi:hypothetical protein
MIPEHFSRFQGLPSLSKQLVAVMVIDKLKAGFNELARFVFRVSKRAVKSSSLKGTSFV